jgi:hypothetical protein
MTAEITCEPRFVCDDHLGKLARYLRVGGFDTVFDSAIDNSRLIQISLDETRHILTKDRRLIERRLVRYYHLIESDRWPDQLRSVMDRFGLEFRQGRIFSRCLEDNALIQVVDRESIKNRVFPYTFEHHSEFFHCPVCLRVYWAGTHPEAIYKRLERAGITILD